MADDSQPWLNDPVVGNSGTAIPTPTPSPSVKASPSQPWLSDPVVPAPKAGKVGGIGYQFRPPQPDLAPSLPQSAPNPGAPNPLAVPQSGFFQRALAAARGGQSPLGFLGDELAPAGRALAGYLGQSGGSAVAPAAGVIESRLFQRPDVAASQFAPLNTPTMANPSGQPGGVGYDPTRNVIGGTTALGRGAGQGLVPAATGVAGAGAGAEAAEGLISLTPLGLNTWARTGAALVGGGLGAAGGAGVMSSAQQALINAMLTPEARAALAKQEAAIQQQQPGAYDVGQLLAQGAFVKPNLATNLPSMANRVVGGAIAGGFNAAQQGRQNPGQPIDLARVGRQTLGGALLSGGETGLGEAASQTGRDVVQAAKNAAKTALQTGAEKAASTATTAVKNTVSRPHEQATEITPQAAVQLQPGQTVYDLSGKPAQVDKIETDPDGHPIITIAGVPYSPEGVQFGYRATSTSSPKATTTTASNLKVGQTIYDPSGAPHTVSEVDKYDNSKPFVATTDARGTTTYHTPESIAGFTTQPKQAPQAAPATQTPEIGAGTTPPASSGFDAALGQAQARANATQARMDAVKAQQDAQDAAAPWNQRLAAFVKAGTGSGKTSQELTQQHYSSVDRALALGKPVPPEVVADHPQLAREYADELYPGEKDETSIEEGGGNLGKVTSVAPPAVQSERESTQVIPPSSEAASGQVAETPRSSSSDAVGTASTEAADATPAGKPEYAGSIGTRTLGVDDATKAEIQADAEALGLTNKPAHSVAGIRASAHVKGLGVEDLRDQASGAPPKNWQGTLPEYTSRLKDLFHASKQTEQARQAEYQADPTPDNKAARDQATIDRGITQRHLDAWHNTWGVMGNVMGTPSEPFVGQMAGRTADEIVSPTKAARTQGGPRRAVNPRSPEWGAKNTNVSRQEYEAAKAQAVAKIKGALTPGSTLNMGLLDPDFVEAAVKMGAFHIEAGARAFGDWKRAMSGDLGDAAANLKEGDWSALYAKSGGLIAQRVRANGGAGSSQQAFIEHVSQPHLLGRKGASDFVDRIYALPSGHDVFDRLVTGGMKALTPAEQGQAAAAYNDTLAGVQAGKPGTMQTRMQAGAAADLLQAAAKAREAPTRARVTAQRQAAAQAKAAATPEVVKFTDARYGKVRAAQFRAEVGDPLLSKVMAGEELTPTERLALGAAHLNATKQNAARPVSPFQQATQTLAQATRESRARLEQERVASLSAKEVVKDKLLQAAPGQPGDPEYNAYVTKLNDALDKVKDTDSAGIAEVLGRFSRRTFGSTVRGLTNASIFSNPSTLSTIFLSHLNLLHADSLAQLPAVAFRRAMFGPNAGIMDAGLPAVKGSMAGLGKAITKGIPEAGHILAKGEPSLQLAGRPSFPRPALGEEKGGLHPEFTPIPAGNAKVQSVVNAPFRAAMRMHGALYHILNTGIAETAGQEMARHIAHTEATQQGLAGAAHDSYVQARVRNLAANPTPEIAQYVHDRVAESMLTNQNAAAVAIPKGAQAAKEANAAAMKRNPSTPNLSGPIDAARVLLQPVGSVPANAAGRAAEYAVGIPLALRGAVVAKRSGQPITPQQIDAISRTFGRGAVGAIGNLTGVAGGAVLAHMALSGQSIPGVGQVTLTPVSDDDKEAQFHGTQVNVNGRPVFDTKKFPAMAPIDQGVKEAELYRKYDQQGNVSDLPLDAYRIASMPVRESPVFSAAENAGNMLAAARKPETLEGQKAIGGLARMMIPGASASAALAAYLDPSGHTRTASTVGEQLQQTLPWENIGGIPGRYALPVSNYPETRRSTLVDYLLSQMNKK